MEEKENKRAMEMSTVAKVNEFTRLYDSNLVIPFRY